MRLNQTQSIRPDESEVTLKDGTSVHIRPIQAEDFHLLIQIFNSSSRQTVYQRFLTSLPELTPRMARYLSDVDHFRRAALIAETGVAPIAVARYEATNDPGLVELALIVVDDWQNRGLGRILLREIFRVAEENGISRFCAHVFGENWHMLHLLATEGQIQDSEIAAGVITVWFTSQPAGGKRMRRLLRVPPPSDRPAS